MKTSAAPVVMLAMMLSGCMMPMMAGRGSHGGTHQPTANDSSSSGQHSGMGMSSCMMMGHATDSTHSHGTSPTAAGHTSDSARSPGDTFDASEGHGH